MPSSSGPSQAGRPLLVTTSLDEARAEVASGRRVILIVTPGAGGAAGGLAGAGLAGGGVGDGVHLFVGDPAEETTRRAAAEMAAELGAVDPQPPARG